MNFRQSMCMQDGVLNIGGVKATDLREKYGTPLYVMDVKYIRDIVRAFKKTIGEFYGKGNVAYASKAFSTKAIYSIMDAEGACIDVVSLGEMYTAVSAGFDLSKAYFHGNNKPIEELRYAIEHNIGVIVIDSYQEISLINELASKYNKRQKVSVRINPGVEAHTHSYIQTATLDSKFGFPIINGMADAAIREVLKQDWLDLAVINCHIGSQIFDVQAYRLAVDLMTDYMVHIKEEFAVEIPELDMGGGFGVHYTEEDPKFSVEEYCRYVQIISQELNNAIENKNLNRPVLTLEPGRSVVAESGITLYTVGAIKEIPNMKKYVCIDGGMADNIRPALYQAQYEAVIANKPLDIQKELVSITGKYCESSDILIKDFMLQEAETGDLLAVFSTGAYNYSMASNYNRNPVPPVVMVEDGKSDYAVKPQTYEDIIRNDETPYWFKR